MTTIVNLTPSQEQEIRATNRSQVQAIIDAAPQGVVSDSQFVFFAAFDGTNNYLNQRPLDTNVAQLFRQVQRAEAGNPNVLARYYQGPGAPDTEVASSVFPSSQIAKQAERAYREFATEAADWLKLPGNAGKKISVVLTSFSRGGGSAAGQNGVRVDSWPRYSDTRLGAHSGFSAGVIFATTWTSPFIRFSLRD